MTAQATDHCSACNAGYALVGRVCKAVIACLDALSSWHVMALTSRGVRAYLQPAALSLRPLKATPDPTLNCTPPAQTEHAVTSAQSALGDDKIAVATCPAGGSA